MHKNGVNETSLRFKVGLCYDELRIWAALLAFNFVDVQKQALPSFAMLLLLNVDLGATSISDLRSTNLDEITYIINLY